MADHWTILGAGAIGCLWAASLRESGKPCTLILREQRLREIAGKSTHLQPELELVDDHRRQLFNIAIADKHHIESPIKRLIVATKARDTLQAVRDIAPHLDNDAVVLLLQNGMGSQEAVKTLLEGHNVWLVLRQTAPGKPQKIQRTRHDGQYTMPDTDTPGSVHSILLKPHSLRRHCPS